MSSVSWVAMASRAAFHWAAKIGASAVLRATSGTTSVCEWLASDVGIPAAVAPNEKIASASPDCNRFGSVGAPDTGKKVAGGADVVSTLVDDRLALGLKPIETTTSTPTSAANPSHRRVGRCCQATRKMSRQRVED